MLAAVAVTLAFVGGARAQGVIDQQTTCNDGGSAQIQFYEPIAQRFTPRGPNLVAVALLLGRFNPPYADTLTMRVVEDSVGGAFVAGVTRLVTAGPAYDWQLFDLPATVLVTPGASYVIELDATNSALGWAHQYELPPRCSYPDGEEIVSGMPVVGLDAAFRTYTLCGNGVLDPGEQCDDGNRDDTDGCTTACTVCGDGIVSPGEECDDGNLVNGDGCDANCTFTSCGNGIVTAGEQCDDGNHVAGDCCSPACTLEAKGASCADDGNECTSDTCDGAGTCQHVPNTAPCSDGNLCDGDDFCSGGTCSVHTGNPCAGEPVCERTCVQTSSLQYTCSVDPAGTACTSDGVACTSDVCNGLGACTHPVAANGTACEDGDRCTSGDTCQDGVCRGGTTTTCDPCMTCDAQSGACVIPPSPGCLPAAPDRSSIVLHHGIVSAATNRVVWRWRGLGDVDKAALGSPGTATGFTFCVYDEQKLRLSAVVPAAGSCAGKPCWHALPLGYRYNDPDGTPDGLQKLQTRAGKAGQARIAVKGHGTRLDLTDLGLTAPVTARLSRSDGGGCWESTYTVPTESDAIQFKARD
jgi:cysteine-rich repeat protein